MRSPSEENSNYLAISLSSLSIFEPMQILLERVKDPKTTIRNERDMYGTGLYWKFQMNGRKSQIGHEECSKGSYS